MISDVVNVFSMFYCCWDITSYMYFMLEDGRHYPMTHKLQISSYVRSIGNIGRATTALVARVVVHERYCWRFYISTIGVTLMFDHDTTTMTVDNILRRYRKTNLCSDDRSSIVALQLLVAEPMSSKRTSWLKWFFACDRWFGYLPALFWLRRSSFAWKKHGKGQVYLSHQAFYSFPRRFSSAWCISTLLTFRSFFRGAT